MKLKTCNVTSGDHRRNRNSPRITEDPAVRQMHGHIFHADSVIQQFCVDLDNINKYNK